jgi:hypothetical protein
MLLSPAAPPGAVTCHVPNLIALVTPAAATCMQQAPNGLMYSGRTVCAEACWSAACNHGQRLQMCSMTAEPQHQGVRCSQAQAQANHTMSPGTHLSSPLPPAGGPLL